MERLRIGVIGIGHMGKNHVRNLADDKRFDLIGVYDTDSEQRTIVADRYGVQAYSTIEGLLESVEAVIIAVPSSLHREVALKAAEYNVHALVEKPLATNLNDAIDIVDAFERKGLKLAVGHIERYNPVFRELKNIINPEDVFYIEACRYSAFDVSGRINDTTVVEDLMIHDVDLVCALMDGIDITSVHGRGETVLSDRTDFATCLIDFGGAAHAVINASRVSQNKERSIVVHTRNSCVRADLLSKALEINTHTNLKIDLQKDNSYMQEGVVQRVYVEAGEPLRAELLAFYNAIVNDTSPEVDGQVGIRAIRICEEVSSRASKQ